MFCVFNHVCNSRSEKVEAHGVRRAARPSSKRGYESLYMYKLYNAVSELVATCSSAQSFIVFLLVLLLNLDFRWKYRHLCAGSAEGDCTAANSPKARSAAQRGFLELPHSPELSRTPHNAVRKNSLR